jgi:hypothetical protein
MRLPATLAGLLVSLTFAVAAKDKIFVTVRAVSHTDEFRSRTSQWTTPGSANTSCSGSANGSATTIGNTTTGTVYGTTNCQTTSTPAQVHQITRSIRDVSNIVVANDQRYLITCRASWVGSNCAPMIDGDEFQAEIDGTTMWVKARKGGNQGKEIRVKYKILDIRPIANSNP